MRTRAKIVGAIRDLLSRHEGFLEVETPVLAYGFGGAFAARPFKSYHNDYEHPVFLRVAPEIPLKQMVVGGFERVFEIGKSVWEEPLSSSVRDDAFRRSFHGQLPFIAVPQ